MCSMHPNARTCLNCEGSLIKRVPIVENGKVSDSAYWRLAECRQQLSDHYLHFLGLQHQCAWHSDSLKGDTRYDNWHDCIKKSPVKPPVKPEQLPYAGSTEDLRATEEACNPNQ